jgi:hypothetical protein
MAICWNPAVAADDLAEILYAVTINDEPVSDGTILLRKGDGIFSSVRKTQELENKTSADGGITYGGKAYYLQRIRKRGDGIDAATQTLHIRLPAGISTQLFWAGLKRQDQTRSRHRRLQLRAHAQETDATKSRMDGLRPGFSTVRDCRGQFY